MTRSSRHEANPDLNTENGEGPAESPLYLGAAYLADLGWPVFPCRERDKQPACLWKDVATTSTQGVEAHWTSQPDANVGVVTGIQSDLLVVDVDGTIGAASLERLESMHGPLPRTPTVRTASGRHYYFKHEPGVTNSVSKVADNIDIRAEGGYVVAPPSVHPTGTEYSWVNSPGYVEVAVAPDWLLDAAKAKQPQPAPIASPGARPSVATTGNGYTDGALRRATNRITSAAVGKRNSTLNEAAMSLAADTARGKLNLTREQAETALTEAAVLAGLERTEIDATIESGWSAGVRKGGSQTSDSTKLAVRCLNDVEPARTTWLWDGRIPKAKLSMISGDPGLGKSTLTIELAARATTGDPMPGETTRRQPTGVLFVAIEDDLACTVVPRAMAAAADLTRILAIDGDQASSLRLPTDVELLRCLVREKGIGLIIIDPVVAYVQGDSHKDQEVRQALQPLVALADSEDVAIVLIRHLNKSTGGSATYRGGGSIGFTGLVRSELLMAKDPEDPTARIIASIKNNLAPEPPSVRFRFAAKSIDHAGEQFSTSRIEWGEECEATADELVGGGGQPTRPERSRAKKFLKTMLKDGPVPVKDLRRAAEAIGMKWRTVERAKNELGIARAHPVDNVNCYELP